MEWAARAAELGAGEILLNSMDADGTRAGFDMELIAAVRAVVSVPVIASGGAGAVGHFPPAVAAGADAVLAASVFHYRRAQHRRGQAQPGRGRGAGPAAGRTSLSGTGRAGGQRESGGATPVSRTSSATSRSLRLVCWLAMRRVTNACSSPTR